VPGTSIPTDLKARPMPAHLSSRRIREADIIPEVMDITAGSTAEVPGTAADTDIDSGQIP